VRTHGFAWTKERRDSLLECKIYGLTTVECSELLSRKFGESVTVKSVENAWYKSHLAKHLLEIDKSLALYDRELRLDDGDYLVTCDFHAPHHSEVWINRALAFADEYNIKHHIIVGDLFDMGFAKWSKFEMMKDEWESQERLDDELKVCRRVMESLDYFDKSYLVCGNHENRVDRLTDGRIQARHIIDLIGEGRYKDKFKVSVYDKLFVGEEFLAVHPSSYSQIGGSTAVRLAEKFHRNVLNAHGHFVALRYDRSGQYMAADIGGMFDTKKIDYICKKTTTHPTWNNGFAVIMDGDLGLVHGGNLGFWGLK